MVTRQYVGGLGPRMRERLPGEFARRQRHPQTCLDSNCTELRKSAHSPLSAACLKPGASGRDIGYSKERVSFEYVGHTALFVQLKVIQCAFLGEFQVTTGVNGIAREAVGQPLQTRGTTPRARTKKRSMPSMVAGQYLCHLTSLKICSGIYLFALYRIESSAAKLQQPMLRYR